MDKLAHLIEHWAEHNVDHLQNYSEWAEIARANGKESIALLLDDVCRKTAEIGDLFKQAQEL